MVFRDQKGDVLSGCAMPETPPNVVDPIHWFEARSPDIDIDSETCASLWDGEQMDYDMAVEALL